MDKKLKKVATFSERFREAFGDRNATEFAQELGLSKQSISAYLNGTRNPIRTTTEAIAIKLDVSPVWLCGFDVPMRSPINNTSTLKNTSTLLDNYESEMIRMYREMNDEGQYKVRDYITELYDGGKYKKSGKNGMAEEA